MNITEVLEIIDSEEEFPGDMPDEMWNSINGDRQAVTATIRMAAHMTKVGIRNRLLEANSKKGKEKTMEWKEHRRKGIIELRPYVPGEDLTGISVSGEDSPTQGGMVARNPVNHTDQWYVAQDYYEKNYEPVD